MFPNTRSGQGLFGISCRKTSPAVFPVFFRLPYTGLPDPERQKNHCESAGQANFSPIPQKTCFDSPENVCRQILRITAPFLFRRPPFSAVFPLKTRRFRRTTNRFLLSETPVWTVLAGKANAFSMSIGPPFKSRRPALRNFPGIRIPVRIMSGISSVSLDSAIRHTSPVRPSRTGFDGTAWRLSGFPAIFCARTRPAFPPDAGMV